MVSVAPSDTQEVMGDRTGPSTAGTVESLWATMTESSQRNVNCIQHFRIAPCLPQCDVITICWSLSEHLCVCVCIYESFHACLPTCFSYNEKLSLTEVQVLPLLSTTDPCNIWAAAWVGGLFGWKRWQEGVSPVPKSWPCIQHVN